MADARGAVRRTRRIAGRHLGDLFIPQVGPPVTLQIPADNFQDYTPEWITFNPSPPQGSVLAETVNGHTYYYYQGSSFPDGVDAQGNTVWVGTLDWTTPINLVINSTPQSIAFDLVRGGAWFPANPPAGVNALPDWFPYLTFVVARGLNSDYSADGALVTSPASSFALVQELTAKYNISGAFFEWFQRAGGSAFAPYSSFAGMMAFWIVRLPPGYSGASPSVPKSWRFQGYQGGPLTPSKIKAGPHAQGVVPR